MSCSICASENEILPLIFLRCQQTRMKINKRRVNCDLTSSFLMLLKLIAIKKLFPIQEPKWHWYTESFMWALFHRKHFLVDFGSDYWRKKCIYHNIMDTKCCTILYLNYLVLPYFEVYNVWHSIRIKYYVVKAQQFLYIVHAWYLVGN